MARRNNSPLQIALSLEMEAFKSSVKDVGTSLKTVEKDMKTFSEAIEKSMERINKSVLNVNASFKKLADSAKEASSDAGGGGVGFLGNIFGGMGGSLENIVKAVGGTLFKAASGAIGLALDQGVKALKYGAAWDDSFKNIGRMSSLGVLNSNQLQNQLLDYSAGVQGANGLMPGFKQEEALDVANLFAQVGKARMDTSFGAKSMADLSKLTDMSGVGGRATGMGTGRTAEVLMEQNRSLNQTMPQLEMYNTLMMAVSRVSGITAEQMSALNDQIVAMGVNYGKSGKEASQFAQEAVVVGGRMAEMGYNVTDMMGKMSQQATGSEYGVIQSLLLGGPAGQVAKRWENTQAAMKRLREMAAGLPEEFREYFIKQAAPNFGLQGFEVSDIMRAGQFKDQTEMIEAGRKDRLGKGMGTDNDYLKQISDALTDPNKFYKSIADVLSSPFERWRTELTKTGVEWGRELSEVIKKNWPEIEDTIKKIGEFARGFNLGEFLQKIIDAIKKFITNPLAYIEDKLYAIYDFLNSKWPDVMGKDPKSKMAQASDYIRRAILLGGDVEGAQPSAAGVEGKNAQVENVMKEITGNAAPLDKSAFESARLMKMAVESAGGHVTYTTGGRHGVGSLHPLGKAADSRTVGTPGWTGVRDKLRAIGLHSEFEAKGTPIKGRPGETVDEQHLHTENRTLSLEQLKLNIQKLRKEQDDPLRKEFSMNDVQAVEDKSLKASVDNLAIIMNHFAAALGGAMGPAGVAPSLMEYGQAYDFFNNPQKAG